MSTRILILGTGLIGASVGLALKAQAPGSRVLGWDADPAELAKALELGAIDEALPNSNAVLIPGIADIYLLATPVLPILDWMQKLAPVLNEQQLVTDVGSTKLEISELAAKLYNQADCAKFLPGHPMAGKESGGAALADAELFRGATWLFTPPDQNESVLEQEPSALESQWRALVAGMGAQIRNLDAEHHDEVCAWVSHLPQMLSTALAALLQDTFSADPDGLAAVQAIGGRALRETTRLGSSPYSMWRDVALTNTEPIAQTLHALEQRLAHLRENLRTPELRDEFTTANRFRAKHDGSVS
ncbi:prephenate dehydrogenase [Granulicella sp. S156]|jgi:prephenate dehydrogenase|uniref:prephenate dehydrogenase n=1 Tax=Granulicella sp. S156 TaxID=1747224 RepID=UPI00131ED029|nr:prephenate dehydrogenase [Granulicella sp. S156]